MKHILFLVVFLMTVTSVQAAPTTLADILHRRVVATQQPAEITSADDFLAAVSRGDTVVLSHVTDVSFLTATDKFGNNCFHLAKDALTLQTLAAAVRRLVPEDSFNFISNLRNQRNDMGETPLMRHIMYGRTDTFELLYKNSDLARAIRNVQTVDKGGALNLAADVMKTQTVLPLSKDNSGRTVAQAALANRDLPGMASVVRFFEQNAPYLF